MALPALTYSQVDFGAGQVTEKAARRDDIKLQRSGLKRSVNTRALASGSLAQRFGRSAYNLGTGRTEIVRFTDLLKYEFLFGDGDLTIRDVEGTILNTFHDLPWTLDTIDEISVAAAERDVFLGYRNTRPKHLRLGAASDIDPSLGTASTDMLDGFTFPVVEGTESRAQTTPTQSHRADLPADFEVGELLLIIFRTGESSTNHTTPTDWTLLATRSDTGRTSIFYRVATGSETSPITIATGDPRRSVSLSYRISGFSSAPEADFAASNTTNPPSRTPSGGSTKTLWLATTSMRRSDQTVDAAPSGYSDLFTRANPSSSDTDNVQIAAAWRTNAASSEDPGDFTITGTANNPHAATISVSPIASATEALKGIDGTISKAASLCLVKSAATSAIFIMDFSANPQALAGARAYGSNNSGFVGSANPNVTITLYGKATLPTLASPGTSLGANGATADTTNESAGRSITSSDTTTLFNYAAIVISHDGSANPIYLAQAIFEAVGASVDANNWLIGPFLFDQTGEGASRQPYVRYATKGIEMLPSARTGVVTVTFSQPVLSASHVGVSFRYHGSELVITTVTDAQTGTANIVETLPPTRRVICSGANARDSFKVGQVVIGATTGAEGLIVDRETSTIATATVTMTIAYPTVVSWSAHGRKKNDPVVFTTTGALPTGVTAGVTYFVSGTDLAAGTFKIAATPGGDVINTSGSQSGTHTGTHYRHALDVIVYKGNNFADGEKIGSESGDATVVGSPGEITVAASYVWDEAAMSDYRGWPASLTYDRSRLTFCDFPQSPRAMAWSAVGAPNDHYAGAEATDAFLEFAPGPGRVRFVIGGNDQFVFTDIAIMYIPISESNPLAPGRVAFRPIAAIGCGTVRPVSMHEGVVYPTENLKSLIGVVPTGQTAFPYRTAAISEFHADLFTGVRALAAMTGGGTQAEQYLWVCQSDGTALVGKFDSSNEWVGFVPVTGDGLIKWISSLAGEVKFNVDYHSGSILFDWAMEDLDEEQYLDGSVPLNQDAPALRPDPEDETLGRLWMYAGLTVDLMDGTTHLGARLVDADGFLVEVAGDDFTGDDVIAGFGFTVTIMPYLPNLPEGEQRGQRMRRRRVKRAAAHVQNSTELVFMGRSFGGATPASDTYRQPGEGRTFAPDITLVKAIPGPLTVTELNGEVTV